MIYFKLRQFDVSFLKQFLFDYIIFLFKNFFFQDETLSNLNTYQE